MPAGNFSGYKEGEMRNSGRLTVSEQYRFIKDSKAHQDLRRANFTKPSARETPPPSSETPQKGLGTTNNK